MGSRKSRGSEGGPSLKRLGGVGVGRARGPNGPKRHRITQPSDLAPGISFSLLCTTQGLPEPVAEFRFHPVRKHRLDWAWPDAKLGLEVEGGIWIGGKHGRAAGIVKDMEKSNLLACTGWRLLRVVPKHLCSLETITLIREALNV